MKKTFGPDTHGPYVFRDEINPVRHYKNDGPLATIEDKACAPCALQCVSRPDFSPTPKSLQEEVMGGAYTSTATPENIQETRDARVMAKFAGAYALYKLGPSALCAEDESKWGGLLSSLGVPNVEGTSRPFWLQRLCTTEASRRRLQEKGADPPKKGVDPRMDIPLSRDTCVDTQTPNGVCEDGGWIGDENFLLADARRANGSDILLGYDCSDCMTALMRQVLPRPPLTCQSAMRHVHAILSCVALPLRLDRRSTLHRAARCQVIIYDNWGSIIGNGVFEMPIPYAAFTVFIVAFISLYVCCSTGRGQCSRNCKGSTKRMITALKDPKERERLAAEMEKRVDAMVEEDEEDGEVNGKDEGTVIAFSPDEQEKLDELGSINASGSSEQIDPATIGEDLDAAAGKSLGVIKAEAKAEAHKPVDKARKTAQKAAKNSVEALIQALPFCEDVSLDEIGVPVDQLLEIFEVMPPSSKYLPPRFDAAVSFFMALCEGVLVGALGFYATLLSVNFDLILVLSSFEALGFTPNIDFSGVHFSLLRAFSYSLPFRVDIGTVTFFASILQVFSTYLERFWAVIANYTACVTWHVILDMLVTVVAIIPVYFALETDAYLSLRVYWQQYDWERTPYLIGKKSKWLTSLFNALKGLEQYEWFGKVEEWVPNPVKALSKVMKGITFALGAAIFKGVQFIIIFLCGRVYALLIVPTIMQKASFTATYNEALASRCGLNWRTTSGVEASDPGWLAARTKGDYRNPSQSNWPWGNANEVAKFEPDASGSSAMNTWYWNEGNKTEVDPPATDFSEFIVTDLGFAYLFGTLFFLLFVLPIVCVYMPLIFTTRDHSDWKLQRLLKRMLNSSANTASVVPITDDPDTATSNTAGDAPGPSGWRRLSHFYELTPSSTTVKAEAEQPNHRNAIAPAPATYTYKFRPTSTQVSLAFLFCWNDDPELLHTTPSGACMHMSRTLPPPAVPAVPTVIRCDDITRSSPIRCACRAQKSSCVAGGACVSVARLHAWSTPFTTALGRQWMFWATVCGDPCTAPAALARSAPTKRVSQRAGVSSASTSVPWCATSW